MSKGGDGLGVAFRIQQANHAVLFITSDATSEHIGEGIVEKKHIPMMAKANALALAKKFNPDLIVFDMVKWGAIADFLREQMRVPVLGSSKATDMLELDRVRGMLAMELCGIKTPPWKRFGGTSSAVEWIRAQKKRYVYKPIGNKDSAHTYVAQENDSSDLIAYLDEMQTQDKAPFILQEFIEGIEVSCEFWYNGNEGSCVNWTVERKKFMNEDIGPSTGDSGAVVGWCSLHSRLKENSLKTISLLRKSTYRGPVDVNTIIAPDGTLYGLEYTMRMGYTAIYPFGELISNDYAGLFHAMATGQEYRPRITDDKLAISVMVSIPPYPHKRGYDDEVPIQGIAGENIRHVAFQDMMNKDGKFIAAGADGAVCVVTARGKDVRECQRRVYRTVSHLTIPDAQYRTDIGEKAKEYLQDKRFKEAI